MCLVLVLLLVSALAVAAAPMRGFIAEEQQQQQQQSAPQGDLISFMQSHQRAFAAANSGSVQQAPSQQAQQAAAQTVPAGASEASSNDVLAALEHSPHSHHALIQSNSAVAVAGPGEDGDGEDFGPCKTCVFVLERIKKGSNMLLPAICSELYHKYPDAYALCHQVLNALSINGNNVRYWLFEGCFKYEIYQSKEWIKPCPSHVMCSVLKDLSAEPFCPALPMEDPFSAGAE